MADVHDHPKRTVLALAVLVALLIGPAAQAAHDEAAVLRLLKSADVAAGKKIAETCAGCHGKNSISTTKGVPHLAGQHALYLHGALIAYKERARTGGGMADVAARLSDADMINVAAYFASLPPFTELAPKQPEKTGPAGAKALVENSKAFQLAREATTPCAACHGEDGNSTVPGVPSVAGQYPLYLEAALKAYRDGGRANDVMKAFAAELRDPDIELIAAYYAAAKPKPANTPVHGDLAAGAAKAATCVSCHGADGNSKDPKTPRLAGLDPEYLAAAIAAYKKGTRNHLVMQEMVASLSEADIKNVAAFYASQNPKPPARLTMLTAAEWAKKCDRCHGPDGKGTDPRFPILAGQREDYLVKALRVYHTGARKNPFMHAMSYPLREPDFRNLADYYAHKGGR